MAPKRKPGEATRQKRTGAVRKSADAKDSKQPKKRTLQATADTGRIPEYIATDAIERHLKTAEAQYRKGIQAAILFHHNVCDTCILELAPGAETREQCDEDSIYCITECEDGKVFLQPEGAPEKTSLRAGSEFHASCGKKFGFGNESKTKKARLLVVMPHRVKL
eukprot:gnl/MRDRNA2_/MRDRNA2_98136_c0_seq1.p1 gnl/MRDRNA2_/MRDRNA2_98136_c0~~gnl/MRDRNA2_/MRDRNA2_98136_c0_seq1.p1  ORF type:complete len:164 (-),score=37.42 gnl/MRDRNA2_/MRDRNA2_98136_c0_seq1:61-552(-)